MSTEQNNLQRISKEKWFSYIEAWEKSGKNQPQFCKENNIPYTTFGYWRTTYLNQKVTYNPPAVIEQRHNVIKNKPGFISVKLPDAKPISPEVIQARFASGLALALPLSMPTDEMIKLIQALEQHHAN